MKIFNKKYFIEYSSLPQTLTPDPYPNPSGFDFLFVAGPYPRPLPQSLGESPPNPYPRPLPQSLGETDFLKTGAKNPYPRALPRTLTPEPQGKPSGKAPKTLTPTQQGLNPKLSGIEPQPARI